jgi:hypothetical protein
MAVDSPGIGLDREIIGANRKLYTKKSDINTNLPEFRQEKRFLLIIKP